MDVISMGSTSLSTKLQSTNLSFSAHGRERGTVPSHQKCETHFGVDVGKRVKVIRGGGVQSVRTQSRRVERGSGESLRERGGSFLGDSVLSFRTVSKPFVLPRRRCHVAVADLRRSGGGGGGEGNHGSQNRRHVERWDVVGLGQAMVDFSGVVTDEFLEGLGLEKGKRKVVNHEERGKVLRALDGNSYKVSAGGSLSNTLVALARLSQGELNVAMTGSVGSDPLGDFYRAKLLRANVQFLSRPVVDGTTGTVVVLTTPDAQRTMLSYQGMSSVVDFDSSLESAVEKSKVLVVEGYLWEIPETVEAIAKACEAARAKGVMVALTASDVSCVLRFRKNFWDVMCESTDILFTNIDEARALAGFSPSTSPALTARHLSRFCPLVSVTDGDRGSYLGLKGEVVYIPPSPCSPVDTCGAGDAYAAGVLFCLFQGVPDIRSMGSFASRVAAVVVGQQGTRLREEDACELASKTVKLNQVPFLEGRVVKRMGMGNGTGSETNANV